MRLVGSLSLEIHTRAPADPLVYTSEEEAARSRHCEVEVCIGPLSSVCDHPDSESDFVTPLLYSPARGWRVVYNRALSPYLLIKRDGKDQAAVSEEASVPLPQGNPATLGGTKSGNSPQANPNSLSKPVPGSAGPQNSLSRWSYGRGSSVSSKITEDGFFSCDLHALSAGNLSNTASPVSESLVSKTPLQLYPEDVLPCETVFNALTEEEPTWFANLYISQCGKGAVIGSSHSEISRLLCDVLSSAFGSNTSIKAMVSYTVMEHSAPLDLKLMRKAASARLALLRREGIKPRKEPPANSLPDGLAGFSGETGSLLDGISAILSDRRERAAENYSLLDHLFCLRTLEPFEASRRLSCLGGLQKSVDIVSPEERERRLRDYYHRYKKAGARVTSLYTNKCGFARRADVICAPGGEMRKSAVDALETGEAEEQCRRANGPARPGKTTKRILYRLSGLAAVKESENAENSESSLATSPRGASGGAADKVSSGMLPDASRGETGIKGGPPGYAYDSFCSQVSHRLSSPFQVVLDYPVPGLAITLDERSGILNIRYLRPYISEAAVPCQEIGPGGQIPAGRLYGRPFSGIRVGARHRKGDVLGETAGGAKAARIVQSTASGEGKKVRASRAQERREESGDSDCSDAPSDIAKMDDYLPPAAFYSVVLEILQLPFLFGANVVGLEDSDDGS